MRTFYLLLRLVHLKSEQEPNFKCWGYQWAQILPQFLTDIISRALFIFRQPPLEGLFCGANTNGLVFIGFQFVPCVRVPLKRPVSPFSSYKNNFCNWYVICKLIISHQLWAMQNYSDKFIYQNNPKIYFFWCCGIIHWFYLIKKVRRNLTFEKV